MTRNTRLLIVLGVAVGTALLASVGVYVAISRQPLKEVEVDWVPVVVAAKALDVGVGLAEGDVKVIKWPKESELAGAHAEVKDVVMRGLIVAVAENEPITDNRLAPRDSGIGLPPAIKVGMRAMSVRVNDVIGVAGFVVPGTRVVVIVTVQRDQDAISRVVVEYVQVLTAGTRYDEAEIKKEGKAIPSSVVTLMVSPSDAERIALAQTEGQITLVLRNPLDTGDAKTTGIRTATLLEASAAPLAIPTRVASGRAVRPPAPSRPPLPPVPSATPYTVEVLRAGDLKRVMIQ
jgi:pilus assembly protein CpaB